MGRPAIDMTGRIFGRLTVVERAGAVHGNATWLCACACGVRKVVYGNFLRNGTSRSCGCTGGHRSHMNTPGGKRSPTYHSWQSMWTRTTNPKHVEFKRYGGRGISVCDRWLSFGNFLADMGQRPAGKTLDRVNNDGSYEPSNCRWATPIEQARNKSKGTPRAAYA